LLGGAIVCQSLVREDRLPLAGHCEDEATDEQEAVEELVAEEEQREKFSMSLEFLRLLILSLLPFFVSHLRVLPFHLLKRYNRK